MALNKKTKEQKQEIINLLRHYASLMQHSKPGWAICETAYSVRNNEFVTTATYKTKKYTLVLTSVHAENLNETSN